MRDARGKCGVIGVTVLLSGAAACSSNDAGSGGSGAGGHDGSTTSSTSTTSTSSGGGGSTAGTDVWVMGYYTSWDDPANGGDYAVSAIDWDGLTHVATAFYLPDGKGGWAPGSFDAGTAAALIDAAHGKGKKVLAS